MKQIVISLCFSLFIGALNAQNQVSWAFGAQKTGDKTYEIHLNPTVQEPWHIYSQSSPEGGALPTKIIFNTNPILTADGKVREVGKIVSKYEEVFGVSVKYFDGKVDFIQIIKLKANVKTNLTGSIEFMVCNDQQCLPPKIVSFNVALK